MMDHRELLDAFVQFEAEHTVERYTSHGYRVWPLLRNNLTFEIFSADSQRRKQTTKPPPVPPSSFWKRKTQTWRARRGPQCGHTTDTVLISMGNRTVRSRDGRYHYQAEPVVEALRERGCETAFWERGEHPPGVRRIEPTRIDSLLNAARVWRRRRARRQGRFAPHQSEPEWFGEFAAWAAELSGKAAPWPEFRQRIEKLQLFSEVFEQWLRRVRPERLIVDCWYSTRSMAAILAARRLGIPSVDLQHGSQGVAHCNYASWTRAPKGDYALMPDAYWVWGTDTARTMIETNATRLSAQRLFTCGNLWLNQWHQRGDPLGVGDTEAAQRLSADASLTILVTLQGFWDRERKLLEAIRDSPRNWLWLIRVHRQLADTIEPIRREIEALGHPNVNVREASEWALYALFQASDVHMTGYSSCAIEALAFGCPSVILHPTGEHLYRDYLQAGVMCSATSTQEVLAAIQACRDVDREACRRAARRVFAPPEEAARELERLLDLDRATPPTMPD